MSPSGPRLVAVEKNVSPYWDRVNAGLEAGARAVGLRTEVLAPPSEDVAAQRALVAQAISSGAEAVAVVATRADAFDDLLGQARDHGMAVLTFDLDAPASARTLYVGTTTPHALGRTGGTAMLEVLGPRRRVVVQTGSATAAGAVGKVDGLVEVLREHDVDVVLADDDGGDLDRTEQIARELLADPAVGGVYGVYAYHAGIQARVLRELGRADVAVVGNDMSAATVAGLRAGTIARSVWIQEYYFGYYTAAATATVLALGPDRALTLLGLAALAPEDRRLALPHVVYTPDDVEDYVAWERRTVPVDRSLPVPRPPRA